MVISFLIIGKDYLEFIDLTEDDGSALKNVTPDAEGLRSGDYHSEPIFSIGIPIGARAELTTRLYVSTCDTCRHL